MTKFHINKHGVPAPCHAQKGKCPLGGADGQQNHFDSEEAAKEYLNEVNAEKYGNLHQVEAESPFSKEMIKEKFPNLTAEEVERVQKYADKELEINQEVEDLKKTRDKASDEYFDRVQAVRKEALKKYEMAKDLPITNDEINEVIEEEIPKPAPWARDANYQFHPRLTEKDAWKLNKVMQAYSGKSKEEIQEGVNKMMEDTGMDIHDASRAYWNTLEQRKDKPFVSLDLETANPKFDKSLEYDNGQLTYVIEVGGIKTYPDGRTEEISVLYGVPKEFEDRHGTGFQNIHNITPDDLRGKPEFSEDAVTQKKVMDFLDGSVVIAHNAYFEEKQLTGSLRGFKAALDNGSIETLDTMNFCKYMVPESARNTNEAFVNAAGYEYSGAHRAHQDATMTLNAFDSLKNNR